MSNFFQLVASKFNLLSNSWVTFLGKSTCWVTVDQHLLINLLINSWSTLSSRVDQLVIPKLINCWSTCWFQSTCCSTVDQLSTPELINFDPKRWSIVTQDVDFSRKVTQLLLNKLNFEAKSWNKLLNYWSTCWFCVGVESTSWSTVE